MKSIGQYRCHSKVTWVSLVHIIWGIGNSIHFVWIPGVAAEWTIIPTYHVLTMAHIGLTIPPPPRVPVDCEEWDKSQVTAILVVKMMTTTDFGYIVEVKQIFQRGSSN